MKVGAVRNNTKVLTLGSPNVVGAVGALSDPIMLEHLPLAAESIG